MIRLAARSLPVFAIIVGVAMALAAYLNFSGVRTAYLDLVRSRMEMTAASIVADIASASAFGISLPEQTTLAELLVRQSGTDPLMRSIDVTGSDGTVLFSSDSRRIGGPGEEEGETLRHTARITNDFGDTVGAVVVRLDRTGVDEAIQGLRADLVASALPAGLAAVIGGCLAVLALLSQLHRRARRFSSISGGPGTIERAEEELASIERQGAA